VFLERVLTDGLHGRTPGIVADLAAGWRWWLDFAVAVGSIEAAERESLAVRVWRALCESGSAQVEQVENAEPCAHFLRLLTASLASGRVHIAAPDGSKPLVPEGWGWRHEDTHGHSSWRPLGRRIGWLDDEALYLEPDASYAAAQELAREQGEALPVSPRTLWRRMREQCLLASWDAKRQRCTVRRTLEGVRHREVLHLRLDTLSTSEKPSTPSTERASSQDWQGPMVDEVVDGQAESNGDRPLQTSTESQDSSAGTEPVDGVDGPLFIEERPRPSNSPSHRRRGIL
jgi:hypothetical protein